jgi:hypothetical protein
LRQGAQLTLKIDERVAFDTPGGHDPANEEAVRTDHLVAVQHAFEHADCVSQDWHVEKTSIPERVLETVGTLDTIPAGEAKGDVVLPLAEKTNAKAASGKNRVVGF